MPDSKLRAALRPRRRPDPRISPSRGTYPVDQVTSQGRVRGVVGQEFRGQILGVGRTRQRLEAPLTEPPAGREIEAAAQLGQRVAPGQRAPRGAAECRGGNGERRDPLQRIASRQGAHRFTPAWLFTR